MGLNRGTEEKVTNEKTGGAKGRKPERYSLIPISAMDHVARLYAAGAEKYDAHNWRRGYDWSLSYDALMRHLTAFWDGEDLDPDWGDKNIPHLAAVVFHALALLTYMDEHPELDDRPPSAVTSEEVDNDSPSDDGLSNPLFQSDDSWLSRIVPGIQEWTEALKDPNVKHSFEWEKEHGPS